MTYFLQFIFSEDQGFYFYCSFITVLFDHLFYGCHKHLIFMQNNSVIICVHPSTFIAQRINVLVSTLGRFVFSSFSIVYLYPFLFICLCLFLFLLLFLYPFWFSQWEVNLRHKFGIYFFFPCHYHKALCLQIIL